jgi:hypothetical protein
MVGSGLMTILGVLIKSAATEESLHRAIIAPVSSYRTWLIIFILHPSFLAKPSVASFLIRSGMDRIAKSPKSLGRRSVLIPSADPA